MGLARRTWCGPTARIMEAGRVRSLLDGMPSATTDVSNRSCRSGAHFCGVERHRERGIDGEQQFAIALAPVLYHCNVGCACRRCHLMVRSTSNCARTHMMMGCSPALLNSGRANMRGGHGQQTVDKL